MTRPIIFQRKWWPIVGAHSFGALADNSLRQALIIGVSAKILPVPLLSNPDDAIPLLGMVFPLAMMVTASLAGQFADKFETAKTIQRLKFAEIFITGLAGLGFIFGFTAISALMLLAMAVQSALFNPARAAAMPKFFRGRDLIRANAYANASIFVSILLGYVVGGFLITVHNGHLWFGSVLFLFSVAGWGTSLFSLRGRAGAPDLKLSMNAFAQLGEMVRILRSGHGIGLPLLGVGAFYFFSTVVTILIPLYGRDIIHTDPLTWTALNGIGAIGAGIGAFGSAPFVKNGNGFWLSGTLMVIAACLCVAIFAAPVVEAPETLTPMAEFFASPRGILIGTLFLGLSASVGGFIAPLQAAIQRRSPKELRARVMSIGVLLNAMFALPGAAVAMLVTSLGMRADYPFLLTAMFMLTIAAIMFYRLHRKADGLFDEDHFEDQS